MCGIVGLVTTESERYRRELAAMTSALRHRGPDAEGVYLFQNCGLGHRRLSIVDLQTGDQPMLDVSGKLAITFNGEIYGYKSLRQAFSNYPYQTTSDTEVIIAMYAQLGTNLLSRLPGMFAFALWDDREQALFCARDRFGEKPFYYAFGKNNEFLFASEIKSILASGLVDPILDRESLAFYLQNFYVHPYRTIYENVFTLPPAHMLRFSRGQLFVNRYWELPEMQDRIDLNSAIEEFSRLLDQAVGKQLIADVPVGSFLSGGLDSSTIVALASQHQNKVKTFSFAFEMDSELPFAREVASLYETDHIELSDKSINVGKVLLSMQHVYDEPFADTSAIPTYLISKMAREHVKVVLTGDGADELLGGYSWWYSRLLRMENMSSWKALFYKAVFRSLRISNQLNRRISPSLMNALDAVRLRQDYTSIAEAHNGIRKRFTDEELNYLGLSPPKEQKLILSRYHSYNVDDALRMDIENWMAGDILVKIDRASMIHGLELRAPFLDVDFASFCISLPTRLKLTSAEDKLILRKAFSFLWPESVRKRPKMGFSAPWDDWFNRKSVRLLVHDYLQSPQLKIFDLIDYNRCQSIVAESGLQTWILLVLSLWMESHDFSHGSI